MPAVHVRTQIRNAVVTALGGLATTGANVNKSHARTKDGDPRLLIETDTEDGIAPVGDFGDLREHPLDIVVTGYAKKPGSGDIDDLLDQISLEVDVAMKAAGDLGGLVKYDPQLYFVKPEFEDLEKTVGAITLRYRTKYLTQAGSPGTPL